MANDATDLYSQIRAAQAKLGDANAASDIAERAGNVAAAGCVYRVARRRRDAHGGARRFAQHEFRGRRSDSRVGSQAARSVQGRAEKARGVHDRAEARSVRRTHSARRRPQRSEYRRPHSGHLLARVVAQRTGRAGARFGDPPVQGRRRSETGHLRDVPAAARSRASDPGTRRAGREDARGAFAATRSSGSGRTESPISTSSRRCSRRRTARNCAARS